jgi:hypothetical protein
MKKPVHIYVCLFLIVLFNGCASTSVKDNSEAKYMLRMLASGAVGNIVAGNFGGFIVGSFIADVVSVARMEYEDRQLEDRDEAATRLKQKYKQAEQKKPDQKKAEEIKEKEKKAEEMKDSEKKAEEKKDIERKAEKQKEREKKAEETLDFEKRVEVYVNDTAITPQIAETGSKVEANIKYTVLGPESLDSFKITETRILANSSKSIELAKRDISRNQGTYSSTLKFSVSEEMPRGYCILYTKISDGYTTRTVKSEVIINK